MRRKWWRISSRPSRSWRFRAQKKRRFAPKRKAPIFRSGLFYLFRKRGLIFALAQNNAFALCGFARQLTNSANRFGLLASPLFRRFFVVATKLHFTEDTFTLKLFLQDFISLVDVIITNGNLHVSSPFQNSLETTQAIPCLHLRHCLASCGGLV